MLVVVMGVLAYTAWLTVVVLVAAWVARDCRNRSADGGVIWAACILAGGLSGPPGAVPVTALYLATRPAGRLVRCRCGNRLLTYVTACPHCGLAREPGERTDPGQL